MALATTLAQEKDAPPQKPPLDRVPAEPAINEQATQAAWKALKVGRYNEAITNADRCIERFRNVADQIQAKLEKEHVEIPTGSVSPGEKQLIAKNAILNDVAACLFIKGQAAEKLGNKEQATQLYSVTKKYSYARVLDPDSEGCWSPAQEAEKRLLALR